MIKNITECSRIIGLFWTICAGIFSVAWSICCFLAMTARMFDIITGHIGNNYIEFPNWYAAMPIITKIMILAILLQIDAFGQIVSWSRICKIVYDSMLMISRTINLAYVAKLDTSNLLYIQYRYDLSQFTHIAVHTFNVDWVVLGYCCFVFIIARLSFGDVIDNLMRKSGDYITNLSRKLVCVACWESRLRPIRRWVNRSCSQH